MFGMTQEDYQRTYDHILRVVAYRMGLDSELTERELQHQIMEKDPMAYRLAELYRNAYQSWWGAGKAVDGCQDESIISGLREALMQTIRERDEYRKSIESYLAAKYQKIGG